MASRLTRNSAILAKIEATYGVDAAPSGAANAMLVANQSVTVLSAANVDRGLVRPYLGGSEQLLGAAFKELSFEVELVGSGTAGTAPAWGPLLRACGWAETVTASTRVDYTLISTGMESATLYYFDDGVLHKLVGARGEWTIRLNVGGKPVLALKFVGLDGGDVAQAAGSTTLSGFKTPQVVNNTNSQSVRFGATLAATGAVALTGGTAYSSQGLELASGNQVQFTPLVGQETVDLTQRDITAKLQLDLTAAQEVAFIQTVKDATLQSMGMVHGTVAGNRVAVFSPSCQLTNPTKADVNGKRLIGFDVRVVPDPAGQGNDELRIVTSF
jgi:hypothetical protein